MTSAEETHNGLLLPEVAAMMAESQFWPANQMRDYQRLQLGQLLRHAQSTTEFYKHRLSGVLRGDGTINWENWHTIPVVKRSDLQTHGLAMQSTSVPGAHGNIGISTSSGSTGVPVHIKIPRLALWVASTAWVRFLNHHGMDVKHGHTEFKAFLPDGKPMIENVLHFPASENKVARTWINRNLPTQRKLDYLQSTNTAALLDTPNHMEVLAHENLRRKWPVQLQFMVGIGMGISPLQEALFNQSFTARTASPYSSKEGTLMAFQCAHSRKNFHICSELVYFEVLDEKDKPVPAGQPGRAVITPFFNSAQPLIRYEQGDIVVAGESCSCGSTLPVLSEIRGRSDAIFRFPDKQVAFNRFDDVLVQNALAADAYQFAQTAPRHIVVRYVSSTVADAKGQELVRQHLFSLIQTDAEVTFHRVATIPFNAGGKQQRVTREF
jgi:phenylacetate-CoA ligase